MKLQRAAALLAGLWAGVLLCLATIATPATFALLPQADAGRVAGRMLNQEAYLSLVLAMLLCLVERRRVRDDSESDGLGVTLSANLLLPLGALFCTVAGYFAVQPMMAAARAGQGALSFGALHAISAGFYLVKVVLVLALTWRLTAPEKNFSLRPSS
jgi:hypothetical protein